MSSLKHDPRNAICCPVEDVLASAATNSRVSLQSDACPQPACLCYRIWDSVLCMRIASVSQSLALLRGLGVVQEALHALGVGMASLVPYVQDIKADLDLQRAKLFLQLLRGACAVPRRLLGWLSHELKRRIIPVIGPSLHRLQLAAAGAEVCILNRNSRGSFMKHLLLHRLIRHPATAI